MPGSAGAIDAGADFGGRRARRQPEKTMPARVEGEHRAVSVDRDIAEADGREVVGNRVRAQQPP
jgi:hypothetical protein